MCGIIAIINKNTPEIPTNTAIAGMLISQISRGQQGFGYVAFDDNVNSYVRREMRHEIESVLEKNTSRSMVFHHRYPTSTPNYADCTHPIKVSNPELEFDYYFVHNGVISNDSILRDTHLELGYVYNTTVENIIKTQNHKSSTCKWNDSEALAIDVCRFLETKQEAIQSKGSIAFIAVRVEKETGRVAKIFFGRNTSPLTFKLTKNTLILRSEGETDLIESNMLYALDMKAFKVTKVKCQIGEVMSSRFNSTNHDDDDWNRRSGSGSFFSKSIFPRSNAVDIDTTEEEFIQDIANWERLQEIDVMVETLSEEIILLQEDKKALIAINASGSHDSEIDEIEKLILIALQNKEDYLTEYEDIESGVVDAYSVA